MNATQLRQGLTRVTPKETSKQRRRRYYLHYHLKKRGFMVNARKKSVTIPNKYSSDTEKQWVAELRKTGYTISVSMI